MGEKENQYSIYGSTTGTGPYPESPREGPRQSKEWMDKMELKPQMLTLLRKLNISFPIRTRDEFLEKIKTDSPTYCEIAGRKFSIKDMISILKDSDFPIRNDIEAANLLASACPVSAMSVE